MKCHGGENVDNGHPKNCTDDDHFSHSVACWKPYGDVLWISNNSTLGSTLYRQGTCTFTSNGWGYCNKDMYEGSLIKLRVCDSPNSERRAWVVLDRRCHLVGGTSSG